MPRRGCRRPIGTTTRSWRATSRAISSSRGSPVGRRCGETDTQEKIQQRVDHDLYYIENWSILLDLYILAITPAALFKTANAF